MTLDVPPFVVNKDRSRRRAIRNGWERRGRLPGGRVGIRTRRGALGQADDDRMGRGDQPGDRGIARGLLG